MIQPLFQRILLDDTKVGKDRAEVGPRDEIRIGTDFSFK